MSDVSNAEVAKAAESVTGSVDSFENAGICVGTESECKKAADEKAKKEAEAMTDEQAIQSLDGAFLHDPTSLTPSQVKGLEALSRQENLTERTRGKIRDFLQDHYNNTDRLGFYGQLGRPDAPHF